MTSDQELSDNELLARRIVVALYCGDLDPYRNIIEDAIYHRANVLTGAPDHGPVKFSTRILLVDGKKVVKVSRGVV